MSTPEHKLDGILVALRATDDHEAQADIGRSELASLLLQSPKLLDRVLKLARRDARLARCLAAARFYSGQSKETCEKIDAFMKSPFPTRNPKLKRR